ncbi:hypothetical protein K0M31_005558 [Melipona bicolor]|uniref:Uncharacterized protein n=1 Tax=Melipona bicolor TaxID=60889 RepID=A0AA40FV94_9HYME|nr:hypothetical protein K0M31_005558 [Melipona bicolor]
MEKHLEATGKRLGEIRKPQLGRGKPGWRTGGFAQRGARKKLSKRRNRRIFHSWDSATLGSLVDRPRKKFGEPARPINPALMSTLTTIHPDHRPGLNGRGSEKGGRHSGGGKETGKFGAAQTGMEEWLGRGEGVSNAKEGLEEWRTQGRKRATNRAYSEKAATGTESGGTCKAAMKAHSF